MRPLKRGHVNKSSSAKSFRHGAARTKAVNINRAGPMRGGIRL